MTTVQQTRSVDFTTPILCATGALFLAVAWLVTPQLLIELGPLRRSLTSANELVRATANFEVSLLRIGSLVLGFLLIGAGVFRRRIVESRIWQEVSGHEPELSGRFDLGVVNKSLFWMAGLALTGTVFVFAAPPTLSGGNIDAIVKEDGLVENLGAISFLLSSLMGMYLLFAFDMPRRHRIMLGILAVCLFVFFGEEISWGQRIFDIETLEAFKGVNVQNENNLHNLFGYLFPSLFVLAVLAYGVCLPFIVQKSAISRNIIDLLGIPIASRGLAIGFALAMAFRDWTFDKVPLGLEFVPPSEIGEFIVAFGFLLLMIEIRRSLTCLNAARHDTAASAA